MAKKMSKKIYMITTEGRKVFLETVRDEESAKARISRYEREDRYEVEVEGYTNSLPQYIYE